METTLGDARPTIYTIGHSNLPIDRFIASLREFNVASIVDVRSAPYSRYVPAYNKAQLEAALRAAQITYRYAGDYLGGRPDDPALYRDGYIPEERHAFLQNVDYERVAETERFRKGLARLLELAGDGVVAVMCSEEDPLQCHRHLLIERALAGRANVIHIRTRQDSTSLERLQDAPLQARLV